MGLLDRLRGRPNVADMQGAVVRTAVLDGEVRWRQPFHWGLLMAFDDRHDWELPEGVGSSQVSATRTFLAVPVLHAQDVEIDDSAPPDELLPEANVEVVLHSGPLEGEVDFAGVLECPSGVLNVGDADEYHLIQVPAGTHVVQVRLQPKEHAEHVVLALHVRA